MNFRRSALVVLIIALFWQLASSQNDFAEMLKSRLLGSDISSKSADVRANSGQSGAADNAIDESRYFIGSGDIFTISIINLPSERYNAEVNQNGDLVIGNLGILPLGKVSLADAKKAIAQWIAKLLRTQNDVYVTLASVKRSSVFVGGVVAKPGTHVLTGTDKLLDALNAAQSGQQIDLSKANYRDVVVYSPQPEYYDIIAAINGSDSSQNPYLYPGDRILLNPPTSIINLSGEVATKYSGPIPPRQNETIGQLLQAFPMTSCADLSVIQLSRPTTQKVYSGTMTDLADMELINGDALFIPPKPDCYSPATVTVKGHALRQGAFPIIGGVTTASELLDRIGGATSEGDISKAVILRQDAMSALSGVEKENMFRTMQMQAQMNIINPGIASSYNKLRSTRDYTVVKITTKGDSPTLQPNDIVFVPRKSSLVYISGNVKNPGGQAYDPSKSARDYIAAAGGFTRRADRRNVFSITDYADGVTVFKSAQNLEAGDILVVPDGQQGKMLQTVVIPLLSITATIALTTVTIMATFR